MMLNRSTHRTNLPQAAPDHPRDNAGLAVCRLRRLRVPEHGFLSMLLIVFGIASLAANGCGGGSGEEAAETSASNGGSPAASRQPDQNNSQTPTDLTGKSDAISIVLNRSPNDQISTRIELRGLSRLELHALKQAKFHQDQWKQFLTVSVAVDGTLPLPPMLGDYRIENETLLFEPRYPLSPGVSYRAVYNPAHLPGAAESDRQVVTQEFSIPKTPSKPTTLVTHVYPSRNTLPENQLKFYLHFSAPMSRGEAYQQIHLFEDSGKEVDYPFLRLDEELWDNSGTRFTLLIDPGRIKQGLKPREDVGPVLEKGKSYTLAIDREWLDAQGNPLKEPFRKQFKVTEPDVTQPNHQRWKLSIPGAGTTEPLVVIFSESLDQGMLERVLVVTDSAGQPLTGEIEVDQQETRWQFRLDQPWRPGEFFLVAESVLEDLAGNSFARLFEEELDKFEQIQRKLTIKTVSRKFVVKTTDGS